jgi:hypothetical protein
LKASEQSEAFNVIMASVVRNHGQINHEPTNSTGASAATSLVSFTILTYQYDFHLLLNQQPLPSFNIVYIIMGSTSHQEDIGTKPWREYIPMGSVSFDYAMDFLMVMYR